MLAYRIRPHYIFKFSPICTEHLSIENKFMMKNLNPLSPTLSMIFMVPTICCFDNFQLFLAGDAFTGFYALTMRNPLSYFPYNCEFPKALSPFAV